jgi:ATP-dependent helicase/nuclease subunit A
MAPRLSVSELIIRIVDETSYAGFVEGTVRAEQIFANLEKLKRIAQRYEQQGFTNLYDFVARLRQLIEEEEEEGQAAIDVRADAVRIMTIHAAKGLEFPIVILPGLERTFQSDKEPYCDVELGIGVTSLNEEEDVPIVEFMRRRSFAKSRAEEKRIFYVACTRARDMLILSGTVPRNRTSHCYMNWMLNGLGVDTEIHGSHLTFDLTLGVLKAGVEQYVATREKHSLTVFVMRKPDLPKTEAYLPERSMGGEEQQLFIEPIIPKQGGEIFSASRIRTYLECPAKYYLRYIIGLPATNIRHARDLIDEDGDVSIPAELRGQAFHYVMQRADELKHDEKTVVGELRKYIQRDSLSILAEPSIEVEKIAASVLEVVRSRFWRDVMKGVETRTEFTIMAPMGNDFLTGTLDRVYRSDDGVWHVLDYKTDNVSRTALQQKASLYEPQLRFYALLIKKLFSTSDVHAHLLFSSFVDDPVSFVYSSAELDQFEAQICGIIASIRRNEFPRPMLPCADCPLAPEGCFAAAMG